MSEQCPPVCMTPSQDLVRWAGALRSELDRAIPGALLSWTVDQNACALPPDVARVACTRQRDADALGACGLEKPCLRWCVGNTHNRCLVPLSPTFSNKIDCACACDRSSPSSTATYDYAAIDRYVRPLGESFEGISGQETQASAPQKDAESARGVGLSCFAPRGGTYNHVPAPWFPLFL